MKAMLLAFVAVAAIAVVANRALDYAGYSAEEQNSVPATVRLD